MRDSKRYPKKRQSKRLDRSLAYGKKGIWPANGVDLGGTKTEALAMDDQGVELERIRVPTIRGD